MPSGLHNLPNDKEGDYTVKTRSQSRNVLLSNELELPETAVDNANLVSTENFDSVSQANSCSINGKSLARAKLAKAVYLKRKLEQRLEMERKLKMFDAEQEIELAELEYKILENEGNDQLPEINDVKDEVEHYIENRHIGSEAGASTSKCQRGDFVYDLQKSLMSIMSSAGLPKIEMMYFDGQPSDYWNFIRQFESVVASKIFDKGQLLSYLLHYCKGKAKMAIQACVTLQPELGYDKARQILRDLFGQEHMIAKSYVDELIKNNRPIVDSAEGLTDFAIKLRNGQMALSQMGYISDLDSPCNLEAIVSRLSIDMQRKWAETADRYLMSGREPNFTDLVEFVECRARIARTRYGMLVKQNQRNLDHKRGYNERSSYVNVVKAVERPRMPDRQQNVVYCRLCNMNHHLTNCPRLLQMNVQERRAEARRLGVCYLCLGNGHVARVCHSGLKCTAEGCGVKHHPLLHIEAKLNVSESIINYTREGSCGTYFGIIPVRLYGTNGSVETYAFVDSGSDTSLISETVMKSLGITGNPSTLNITTVNGTSVRDCSVVSLELFSMDGQGSVMVPAAYTIDSLPVKNMRLPTEEELSRWKHLSDIRIPRLNSTEVGILIGCDVPDAHWVLEQRIGGRKQPFGVRTHLGWMVMGPSYSNSVQQRLTLCCCSEQFNLSFEFERLYNHEFGDIDSFRKELSIEDKRALKWVSESAKLVNGHFEISLPWKFGKPELPNNRDVAIRRLECLRKRFLKDNNLCERYKEVMNGHLRKGYIVEMQGGSLTYDGEIRWYIPHHPVLNPKKPEKLRVVFDCAASYQNTSLNKQLLQGPNTVNSLVGVLLRFRKEAVALAADIEEMFLQVKIPEKDRSAFRLLWWKDGDIHSNPTEYALTVHPFGAISSPFCAHFALRKTVETFGMDASKVIQEVVDNNFYVDDCLVSLDNESEAISFIEQLSLILRKGGFRLTKWMCNRVEILHLIPESERAPSVKEIDYEMLPVERTLGLYWDTQRDKFLYQVNIPERPITRRGILSCVSSIYDPLGLVSPFILPAKQLLQRLCRCGIGWDEDIPDKERRLWMKWCETAKRLVQLSFPRCLKPGNHTDIKEMQLHVFSDASEMGYGAVAYIRYLRSDGTINCSLVMSKSRVAPLKFQTVPRLELTAAVLAVRMSDILQNELKIKFDDIIYWTDSAIVLHYINSTQSRFKTFVANRISTIHSVSMPKQWRFIPSEDNISDWASRGLEVIDERVKCWIDGPPFLRRPEDAWPQTTPDVDCNDESLEIKKKAAINIVLRETKLDEFMSHYSDWFRLLKAVVWLHRFKSYLMIKFGGYVDTPLQLGLIKVNEIRAACLDIIRLVQCRAFGKDLEIFDGEGNKNAKKSPLRKLNPILIDGILCVGGRLQNTPWQESRKHPMILPSKHPITDLIIRHYHILEGHVGATQVLACIRSRFWILRGGVAVRRITSNCMSCRKRNMRPVSQIMAPLPTVRVESSLHPFTSVGVDFFGPIMVKRGRVVEKRYGCVFTCLSMRAVHLEIAHSLSSDSFIMSLMRFISRRGHPKEIYCDNGSNFVGAKNELLECLRKWSIGRIHQHLLIRGIDWHFNPPSASHWGGAWERMIRSVRKILGAISNEQLLTDECLLTLMAEAERILNNRPLVPVTSDANDLDALTPSKLLLLRDNATLLDQPDLHDRYSKRWRRANYLAEVFWKRWNKEYVATLQQRHKWSTKTRNLRQGDLVMIISDMNARNQWPLGLVEQIITSNDGLVRQVQLKTANGTLIRDIRKLCLLEAVEEDS